MREESTTVDRALGRAGDFDLRDDGSWIGLFERPEGLRVSDSHGQSFALDRVLRFPILRGRL
jgi:hypothetical protein